MLTYLHSGDLAIEGCDVQWGVVVGVGGAAQLDPSRVSNQNLTGDVGSRNDNYCIAATLEFEYGNETTHLKNRNVFLLCCQEHSTSPVLVDYVDGGSPAQQGPEGIGLPVGSSCQQRCVGVIIQGIDVCTTGKNGTRSHDTEIIM